MKNYLDFVRDTDKTRGCIAYTRLFHYISGLTAEAGEVSGVVQKCIREKKGVGPELFSDVVRDQISSEIGDVLWYATAILDLYDLDIEKVLINNKDKLKNRGY